jgi:hypothetical protein
MAKPTINAVGGGDGTVSLTVSAGANIVAYVAVQRDFSGGAAPTMNGGTSTRTQILTVASWGHLDVYRFTSVPTGTVEFVATGRMLSVIVLTNASGTETLVTNSESSGGSAVAQPVTTTQLQLHFLSSVYTTDKTNPSTTVAVSVGSGTVTKRNETQRFDIYEWTISNATSEVSVNQSSFRMLWSYTDGNPFNMRNVYFVTDYVEPPNTKGPFTSYISVMPSSSTNSAWLDTQGTNGYQLQKVLVLSQINVNGGGQILCYMLSGSKY